MSKTIIVILVLALSMSGGCSFFKNKPLTPGADGSDINSSQVFNRSVLQQGGQLLIEPFLAGEAVYATDELDKLALRVVRGMAVTLVQGNSQFRILSAPEAQQAQIILRGHFTKWVKPGGLKKWILHKKSTCLSVDGELVSADGEVLAKFSHERQMLGKQNNSEDLALQLGEDIARFLLSLGPQAN
jgi:hypothetical protein